MTRRSVTPQVAALTPQDRRELAGLGVSVGRLAVFLPALQRSEAMRLRARLFAVRHGQQAETGPDGLPSVLTDAAKPSAFFLACGYFPAGPRVVRLDRLERAAALLSRLSRTGPFVLPAEFSSILGCRDEELSAVLAALGSVERDGRFERRARARGAPQRTHDHAP